MAEEKKGTIYQQLNRMLNLDGFGFEDQQPSTTPEKKEKIIIKGTSPQEIHRKGLELEQKKSLQDKFFRTTDRGFQKALQYEAARLPAYVDYEGMEFYPIISSALDLFMEECTTVGVTGKMFNIYSNKERIKFLLEEFFYDIVNVNVNLPFWTRNLPIKWDSMIPLLDGTVITIKEISERLEINPNEEIWTYSIQKNTKNILPGKIIWCGLTRTNTQIVRINLDDNTYVETTPDHEFLGRNGEFIKASDLKVNDSLMPFYTSENNEYEEVYNPATDEYNLTHKLVSNELLNNNGNINIYHKDLNIKNNHPNNLLGRLPICYSKPNEQLVSTNETNTISTLNHKVTSVIYLNKLDDVYCMEVVGQNGEHDRHNFPICSKNEHGEYNRNGIFVSNCKYGDNFVLLYGERKKGITHVRQMVNYEIERFERIQGGKPTIIFKERMTGDEFNIFEIAHFRLLGDDKYLPYGSCLLYDTEIKTLNGTKEIKDIIKGDVVYSFDVKTQKLITSNVLDIVCNGEKNVIRISTQHNHIKATDNHRILIYDYSDNEFKYKFVSDLKIGDGLIINKTDENDQNQSSDIKNRKTDDFIVEKIISFEDAGKGFVYDIHVDDENHNFLANNIVVHNSILNKIRRVFRQLVMAEDAMLTYRIIRAGEKKVFKIDVGNIDEDDIEDYIYKVATKFKKLTSVAPNDGQINYRFNIMGNDEDYFLPVRNANVQTGIDTLPGACLSLDTEISLLDGRNLKLSEIIKEHDEGKRLWSYSINPNNGNIVPGKITWAGVTRKNTQVIKLTLDNGKTITTTPDHKFPTKYNGIKEAQNLNIGESLWVFETKIDNSNDEYSIIYDHHLNKWVYVHQMVDDYFNENENLGRDVNLNYETNQYDHKIESIELLVDKQDTGTITIDGGEVYHNFHNFALTCGVFTQNSNLNQIQDIEYLRDNLFIGLGVPKPFLSFQDAAGGGKNLAQYDIRFAKKINRIQQSLIQELNKMAMIHLYLLGYTGEDLVDFTLTLTNPSVQQELLKSELMREKAQTYTELTRGENGIAAMSHTNAKKVVFNWSEREIIDDLKQQKMEKVVMQELVDSPVTIKKTGLFTDIDKKYGAPEDEMSSPPEGDVPPAEDENSPEGNMPQSKAPPTGGLDIPEPPDKNMPPMTERKKGGDDKYNNYLEKMVMGDVHTGSPSQKRISKRKELINESNFMNEKLNKTANDMINEIDELIKSTQSFNTNKTTDIGENIDFDDIENIKLD